ncbi:MAG TPA: hypothetical protein PLG64_02515, partial [Bacteroidales bacterium]|nr:hypothetical protein [Bacteroidales bacterium]
AFTFKPRHSVLNTQATLQFMRIAALTTTLWSFKVVRQRPLALVICCAAAPIIIPGCFVEGGK